MIGRNGSFRHGISKYLKYYLIDDDELHYTYKEVKGSDVSDSLPVSVTCDWPITTPIYECN